MIPFYLSTFLPIVQVHTQTVEFILLTGFRKSCVLATPAE